MQFTLPLLKRFRPRTRRQHCDVCNDDGVLLGSFVFGRRSECNCGAGAYDVLTLHDGYCDTVPCPFCRLLGDR